MKKRIVTGWTIQRVFLLLSGPVIMFAAIFASQWAGAAIGGFLVAMGLFGYQRGAGNCYGGSCKPYGSAAEGDCCLHIEQLINVDETETFETTYESKSGQVGLR